MPIHPDQVAVYIRWSTEEQTTGTTLDVQRDACMHYVRSQGWRWNEELLFVDDGYSGGRLARPAMGRLRAAVRQGAVDCVVVYKIDRLSRNIVDATQLVLREWKDRCHLKSVLEPIDTLTDIGRMIFGILAMFADFERSAIRDRTLAGKVRRIVDGEQMHGRPAFGYMPHPSRKGCWVEHPGQAPVVRRMFRLVMEGMSANQVVRLLNADRIPTATGRQWTIPSVLHLLHNTTYMGVVEYGRTSLVSREVAGTENVEEKPKRVRVRHGAPRVRAKTQAVPALVSAEVFAAVQTALAANRARLYESGGRAMASKHLLVGISQCACGTPLVFKPARPGRPHHTNYYICPKHRAGTCTAGGHIPAEEAEEILQREFLALFGMPDERNERLVRRMSAVDSDRMAVEASLDSARRDLQRLDREDQQVLRAARSGKLPLEDLADLRQSVRRDREEAERRLRALEERRDRAATQAQSFMETIEALNAVDHWNALEVWQKRQLMRMCLNGRIVLRRAPDQEEITMDAPWTVDG